MKTLKGFVQYLRDNTDKIDQQHACYVQSIGNKCCFLVHAGIYFAVEMRPWLPEIHSASEYAILNQIPEENHKAKQVVYAGDGYTALEGCLKEQHGYEYPTLEDDILYATELFDEEEDLFSSEPWPMHPADVLTATYPKLLTD